MSEAVKYRVIGGAVIIALFVIFYPLLHRGPVASTQQISLLVPPAPKTPKVNVSAGIATTNRLALAQVKIDAPKATQEISVKDATQLPTKKAGSIAATRATSTKATAQPVRTTRAPLKAKASKPHHNVVSIKQPPSKSKAIYITNLPQHAPVTKPAKTTHWVVQLASFNQMEHATTLMKQLRRQGFKPFTKTIRTGSGQTAFRLMVGPSSRHATAQRLQERLHRLTRLKGFLVSYPKPSHQG